MTARDAFSAKVMELLDKYPDVERALGSVGDMNPNDITRADIAQIVINRCSRDASNAFIALMLDRQCFAVHESGARCELKRHDTGSHRFTVVTEWDDSQEAINGNT